MSLGFISDIEKSMNLIALFAGSGRPSSHLLTTNASCFCDSSAVARGFLLISPILVRDFRLSELIRYCFSTLLLASYKEQTSFLLLLRTWDSSVVQHWTCNRINPSLNSGCDGLPLRVQPPHIYILDQNKK